MAITFKDFFRGLAETAPMMANLVHDYTIWKYQTGYQERKFALEERVAEAEIEQKEQIGEYYQEQLRMDKQLFDATFENKVRLADAQQGVASLSYEVEKLIKEGKISVAGSVGQYETDRLMEKINETGLQLDNLGKLGQMYDQNIKSDKAREWRAGVDAEREKLSYNFNLLKNAIGTLINPQDAEKIESIFSKSYNPKNGDLDYKIFFEEIKQFAFMPQWHQDALSNVIKQQLDMSIAWDNIIDQQAELIRMNLYSTDRDERKQAFLALGYKEKELDLRDRLAVNDAIDNYRTFRKEQPLNKKLRALQDYIGKPLKNLGIPGYGYEEEQTLKPRSRGAGGKY